MANGHKLESNKNWVQYSFCSYVRFPILPNVQQTILDPESVGCHQKGRMPRVDQISSTSLEVATSANNSGSTTVITGNTPFLAVVIVTRVGRCKLMKKGGFRASLTRVGHKGDICN